MGNVLSEKNKYLENEVTSYCEKSTSPGKDIESIIKQVELIEKTVVSINMRTCEMKTLHCKDVDQLNERHASLETKLDIYNGMNKAGRHEEAMDKLDAAV